MKHCLLNLLALALSLTASAASVEAAPFRVTKLHYQGGGADEFVVLRCQSRQRLNLNGWSLLNGSGASYVFAALRIKRGQQFTLFTGSGVDLTKGGRKRLHWSQSEERWSDQGGTLTLRNKRGKTVLRYSYGPSGGKRIFFIHHSTGEIYWNGGMRAALAAHGYPGEAPWWDGGTDPQDFYDLFRSSANWELLKDSDIIIFKSCFPASAISSDSMLEDYKNWYRRLYSIYQNHPEKLFVPMSTPPLLRIHTSAAEARRALEFESWLLGQYKTDFTGSNLAPFGLHSLLSDSSGFLHADFIGSPQDDHPNSRSGEVVGNAMWRHLDAALH